MATNNANSLTTDPDRHQIALDAAMEVEQFADLILREAKQLSDCMDITMRGLAIRLHDLSIVIMEALSEEQVTTKDLIYRLHGEHLDD